ncbi:DUF2809 domain-containing protein [Crocosphaera sp. XPORK-15E]|uniref:ribosomal maturation YjgA family protein n=1 Tax=Crocosphaera sp. XPORK-15E TaxID=3110247 RepID=UPI002B213EDD|nr:DUF2809 domain-containing protein [Crocosphaera sp. XPORK-15E]MEA5536431.1 DUF2809 domain-containing protein [Crocosphaera sp. XPORK-15E]
MKFLTGKPLLITLSILIVIPLGLYSKYYQGIGHQWVNDYGAAIWYEIFWCLFAFYFFFQAKFIKIIPIYVFIITCLLEILQLWNPPLLVLIRSHILGKLLLGTTFSWWDFPHYLVGCFLGWLWLKRIRSNHW